MASRLKLMFLERTGKNVIRLFDLHRRLIEAEQEYCYLLPDEAYQQQFQETITGVMDNIELDSPIQAVMGAA